MFAQRTKKSTGKIPSIVEELIKSTNTALIITGSGNAQASSSVAMIDKIDTVLDNFVPIIHAFSNINQDV